jgi:aryl-alcohol dehydrogenase-like predicted oxidoreductase
MEKRRLGRTDLHVTAFCLGTMTFGEQNTEAEGHAQMDYAIDRGINFFDTAELYAIPPKPETQGRTEEIIGTWLKARGKRDDVILASKVCGRGPNTWFRDDGSPTRLTKKQIDEAVFKSLKRLQTDYIDLYQTHFPERNVPGFGSNPVIWKTPARADDETSIAEGLDALDQHVKAGRIRHVGLSNETTWGLMQHIFAAEARGLSRVVSIQNAYSLLNRTFEINLAEASLREDVGLLAYSPLAQGFLTGKYLNGMRPAGARTTLFNRGQRYQTPNADAAIAAYVDLAARHALDPSQLAIAFVKAQPFVTSVILGATKMEQLKLDIDANDLTLSDEIRAEIDAIHLMYTNPCP